MKFPLFLLATTCLATTLAGRGNLGAVTGAASSECPTVNLPNELTQPNWQGRNGGGGSCVHASLIMLLRWQGEYEMADYWRGRFGGGEFPGSMRAKMDAVGVVYAWSMGGDEEFLEWACRTRRGAAIRIMSGRHMVNLVYLDSEVAGVLDNNGASMVYWISREKLLADWKGCGGWAFTPVYSPAAPLPLKRHI